MVTLVMNRLKDFSEWGQCQVLELLRRYRPSSENELFDILVSESIIKTSLMYLLGNVIVDNC